MLKNLTATTRKLFATDDHLKNLLCLVKAQRSFYAFDSEFLASGKRGAPEDIHTVQFSDGKTSVVLESADDLKRWLYNHNRVRVLFGFILLPDLGSIEEWLGDGHVSYKMRGSQTVGSIKYRSFNAIAYDCRPLLQSFGVRKLADAGDIIGFPKLQKPEWLGLRKWQTPQERSQFLEYAKADAIITSRIVQWLSKNFSADPQRHASAGTLARDIFNLSKRLSRRYGIVTLSPLETRVRSACYAGRSEGFRTGFIPNTVYNDASSLYPVSMCATRSLEIVDIKPCDPSELTVNGDLTDSHNFGWIEGVFKSKNDFWGIPIRAKNNIYTTGTVTGFYHTFDLAAAKADVLYAARAYKPIFQTSDLHDKFMRLTLDRIEGRLQGSDKMFAKAVLNSLSGKLGQSHPISATSNFFAYSTLLAFSHLIMSKLFAKCKTELLAMDTDSIFSHNDMSGKWFELNDGETSIPVIMDAKGKGDLAFFRSKNYILRTKEGENVYARHGWCYFLEDFLKLFNGDVTTLQTRRDIKHTLLTREKEALALAKGRWKTKPVTLTLEKIKALLKADSKRQRVNFDSYSLVMQHRSEPSKAWNYDDLAENVSGCPF